VKDYIDKTLVEQIDATDNGMNIFKPTTSHLFDYDISSAVASFRSVWGEKDSIKYFRKAVEFAKHIIKREIKQVNSLLRAKKLINRAYRKSKNKKLLIINANIPRYLVNLATDEYKKLFFLVFKDQKNWKVIAIRKKIGSFKNKKNLPKPWAGLRDKKLQEVTGVTDAEFCHRALFMVVAKSKEGAIKLAEIAVES